MHIKSAVLVLAVSLFISGCGEDGKAPKDAYRVAPIQRSDLVRTVEATGKVTPRNSSEGIPVGAQVTGKVIKLLVDYNSPVTKGQVVAKIDPQIYQATYDAAVAQLHANEATVAVNEAKVATAEADLKYADIHFSRSKTLRDESTISTAAMDQAVQKKALAEAALKQAQAALLSSKASVEQQRAMVSKAKADLDYCTIISPVNGIVIDRKIEEGETLVSSFNASAILTVAENLKVVWIEAKIPEADIGNIKLGQSVTFTADAYRQKFTGKVKQIRRAASTVNNVVIFPVIIEADNPDEKLFPGMTATLSIETGRANNAVVVSAAALRFEPKAEDKPQMPLQKGPVLWIRGENGKLNPVPVKTGITDDSFVVIEDGEKLVGQQAVVGYQQRRQFKEDVSNPFMPKPPKHGTKGTAPRAKGA